MFKTDVPLNFMSTGAIASIMFWVLQKDWKV